jgi:hypothetical protein
MSQIGETLYETEIKSLYLGAILVRNKSRKLLREEFAMIIGKFR